MARTQLQGPRSKCRPLCAVFLVSSKILELSGGRDLKPQHRAPSASPASVDKLHGLHSQCSGHNVIRVVPANSDHHQPIQLAHDKDQVILQARTLVRDQTGRQARGFALPQGADSTRKLSSSQTGSTCPQTQGNCGRKGPTAHRWAGVGERVSMEKPEEGQRWVISNRNAAGPPSGLPDTVPVTLWAHSAAVGQQPLP